MLYPIELWVPKKGVRSYKRKSGDARRYLVNWRACNQSVDQFLHQSAATNAFAIKRGHELNTGQIIKQKRRLPRRSLSPLGEDNIYSSTAAVRVVSTFRSSRVVVSPLISPPAAICFSK